MRRRYTPGKLGYGKGVYDIEVNLNTMKMTLTSKSIDYSTAYSMTGEPLRRLGQPHVPAQEER